MAFQRNHVSNAERLEIGLHVFRYKSVYLSGRSVPYHHASCGWHQTGEAQGVRCHRAGI